MTQKPVVKSKAAARLTAIKREIRTEHKLAFGAFRQTLSHATLIGALLIEAKGLVGHGEWAQWIADNCGFSLRSAQAYMRLAENRGASKAQRLRV